MTETSELRADAVSILAELPTAYVRLHVAVTAPRRKKGGGVRVSGGTRDYVPLNVEADAEIHAMHHAVTTVHRVVAETFGEIRTAVSFDTACHDLARWSDIWTRLTAAPKFVDELRKSLARANRITDTTERATALPQSVCPNCLSIGGMSLLDGTGEEDKYRCDKCSTSWNPEGYNSAIAEALAAHASAA